MDHDIEARRPLQGERHGVTRAMRAGASGNGRAATTCAGRSDKLPGEHDRHSKRRCNAEQRQPAADRLQRQCGGHADTHHGKADDPGRRRAAHDPGDGGQGGAGDQRPGGGRGGGSDLRGEAARVAGRAQQHDVGCEQDCNQQDDHELRRHQHEAPLRDAATERVVHGADLDQPFVEHDLHDVDHRRRRADDPGDVPRPIMKRHVVRKRFEAQHQDRELEDLEAQEESDYHRRPRSAAREHFAPDGCRDAHHLPFLCQARNGRVSSWTKVVEEAPSRPMVSMPTTMSG